MTIKLTKRESEILDWIQKGQSNKVIARRLNIAESTVKAHMSKLLEKHGVQTRVQLAMYTTQGVTVNLLPIDLEPKPIAWVEMDGDELIAISLVHKDGWQPMYLKENNETK